ncbi:MAG TPA: thioredoxin [Gemmatimonadaceae bacterium]|jgi:thioredoxin 2|nr:thioredoxin [Gemmatimonadaceae bacterium]
MDTETKTEPEKKAQTRKLTVRCQFCNTWNRIDASKVTDGPKCGKCAKPILLERPVPLNDETFARTISESELPVAVDFYADWCGPCRMMAPAVDALAAHMQGKALIGKLNTDHASRTASGFNIRGIPTTIVFKEGKEVARQSGAMQLDGLKQLMTRAGVTV